MRAGATGQFLGQLCNWLPKLWICLPKWQATVWTVQNKAGPSYRRLERIGADRAAGYQRRQEAQARLWQHFMTGVQARQHCEAAVQLSFCALRSHPARFWHAVHWAAQQLISGVTCWYSGLAYTCQDQCTGCWPARGLTNALHDSNKSVWQCCMKQATSGGAQVSCGGPAMAACRRCLGGAKGQLSNATI